MTPEDKQLLLKDLCARLPYEVILLAPSGKVTYETDGNTAAELLVEQGWKSYLRPMNSITEEESAELSSIISEWFDKELFDLTEEPFLEYALSKINYSISPLLFDWLNKNMFDYRGLIEKGLAIKVTKENNPYKPYKD